MNVYIRLMNTFVASETEKGRKNIIDTDFYRYHIMTARKDERLQMGEFVFYTCILNLFDISKQEYLHLPARDYLKETTLSLGTIGNAMPRLVELGYLQGCLYPNERSGRDSWRLYLVDLRPGKQEQEANPMPPPAVFEHIYAGKKLIITIEESYGDINRW